MKRLRNLQESTNSVKTTASRSGSRPGAGGGNDTTNVETKALASSENALGSPYPNSRSSARSSANSDFASSDNSLTISGSTSRTRPRKAAAKRAHSKLQPTRAHAGGAARY